MRSMSVAAGGVVGTLARWGIAQALPPVPPGFPWATLVANVGGALGLGFFGVVLLERSAAGDRMRRFLGIGLFGSLTTFSTMSLEGIRLIDSGRPAVAMAYWLATLGLGLLAGLSGTWLGRLGVLWGKESR